MNSIDNEETYRYFESFTDDEKRDFFNDYVSIVELNSDSDAYTYNREHPGFLYKSKVSSTTFLHTTHELAIKLYHSYYNTSSDYECFGVKSHTYTEYDYNYSIKKLGFACTDTECSVEFFREVFDRIVEKCFNITLHNLDITRTEVENGKLVLFSISGIRYCSYKDYVSFVVMFINEGIVDIQSDISRRFWDVDIENKSITIHSRYVSEFVLYNKTKKKVCDCFDHNYNIYDDFIKIRDTGNSHIKLSNRIDDLGEWTSKTCNTTTPILDTKKEEIYKHFTDNELIVIKAGTGCTKTVTVTKCLKRYVTENPGYTVLVVSNRIIYADSMEDSVNKIDEWDLNSGTHEYAHIRTSSYTKYAKDIFGLLENDIILMSIESLMNLNQRFATRENPFYLVNHRDQKFIIVLDEITETLTNIYRSTVKMKFLVFEYLKSLISNAHKVVTMSDDMNYWAIEKLRRIRRDSPAVYYELTKRSLKHVAYFSKSVSLTINLIIKDITQNKNLLIVCGTKRKANFLKQTLIASKKISIDDILVLTSEENSDFMKTRTIEEWAQYRVVIYSPKVTSGVSFNENHFHRSYVFLWNKIPVVTYKQMVARARNLKDNIVFYCFENANAFNKYSINKEDIKRNIETASIGLRRFIIDTVELPEALFCNSLTPEFKLFKDMFIDTIIDKHQDYNNFETNMYTHIIEECGNKLGNIDDLIDFNTIFPPTVKENLISESEEASIKLAQEKKLKEQILAEAIKIRKDIITKPEYRYSHKRRRGQEFVAVYTSAPLRDILDKFKLRKTLLPDELIKKQLYELICYHTSMDLFIEHTESTVSDFIHRGSNSPFFGIHNWNSIALPLKTKLFRQDFDINNRANIEYKFMKDDNDDLANIVIKILADLYSILSGVPWKRRGYEAIIDNIDAHVVQNNYASGEPDIVWKNHVQEILNAQETDNFKAPYWFLLNDTNFAYNPYMLLLPEHCRYLRDNVEMIHQLLYKGKKRDDQKYFTNCTKGQVSMQSYIFKDRLLGEEDTNFLLNYSNKMSFEYKKTTAVVVYAMFRKLLKKYFSIKLFVKPTKVSVSKLNVDKFTKYEIISDFEDYLISVSDEANSERDDCIKKHIYSVNFDVEAINKKLKLSKFFSFIVEDDNAYIPEEVGGKLARIEKQRKKQKKNEELLLNIT